MRNDIKIENKYLHDYNYIDNPVIFNDVLLYQIGEIYCDNSAVVASHIHEDFFEISLITDGEGMFISNDKKQIVKKGDCFVSLPKEKHEIISDSFNPLRYFYIAFSFTKVSKYREFLYSEDILNLSTIDRTIRSKEAYISNAFINMISAFERKNHLGNVKFELLVKTFTIDIHEILCNDTDISYSSPVINNEDNIYYSITKYIDKNLLTISNLKEVASALNHNYSYLSRIFKKKFGKTMHEYYSIQKLNLAKKLIENNDMSLTRISNYLNYTSVYVFSRSFKNEFNMSPKAYKESLKKEQ